MNEVLKNSNFLLYAAKHYENPDCLEIAEFHDDINRIKYIKRLLNKYVEDPTDLKEKLIINHLVIFFNMFGVNPGIRMIFFKLKDYRSMLVPFLMYMGQLPEFIFNLEKEGSVLNTSEITIDVGIANVLRGIRRSE